MHGTKDEIAYPRSSQTFAEVAPKDKLTIKMWEGFKHELHTDPEKAEVFKVMIDWLDKHYREKNIQPSPKIGERYPLAAIKSQGQKTRWPAGVLEVDVRILVRVQYIHE
jgi:hypothetical protein